MRSHFRLFSFTVAVTGLALSGLALFSSVPTSALIASVAPATSAGAASGSTVSMLGFWNSHAYITDWGPTFPADKPPGGPYPNPTTITSYDPATGAFSGIDDAWGVGRENITGTLHKDGAVTYTIVDPGNVLHGTGTVIFDAETTTATWKGTWSNSIGEHGTSYGTWKGFRISGTVRLGCSFCSATPALPVVGVDVGVHGSYSLSNTLTTDSDGRFKDVLPSGSYSVTPDVAGWTFTPASREVTSNGTAVQADFDGCPAAGSTSLAGMWSMITGPPSTTLQAGFKKCFNHFDVTYDSSEKSIHLHWDVKGVTCEGGPGGTVGFRTIPLEKPLEYNWVFPARVIKNGKKKVGWAYGDFAPGYGSGGGVQVAVEINPKGSSGSVRISDTKTLKDIHRIDNTDWWCWPKSETMTLVPK